MNLLDKIFVILGIIANAVVIIFLTLVIYNGITFKEKDCKIEVNKAMIEHAMKYDCHPKKRR